ncbi:hypothetical protein CMI45_00515 [Candidatus Pacearchaeota archaeon]|nr:hypothetical protein [Candidatus Pacearchaeota archaeon]|tara:strand:- start:5602 stop:5982 length:381 start_codon:yes stop_codon:yes gene_type:complete
MAIKLNQGLITAWFFLTGVVLALGIGIFASFAKNRSVSPTLLAILVILGLISGYFVSEKDSKIFLMASVSLVLASFAGIRGLILSADILGLDLRGFITTMLGSLLFFFIPSTIFVALKTVFSIANN